MKLRYSFEIVRLGEQSVAVPVGTGCEQFGGILECNETAAAILSLLADDTTEAQIIEAMEREYEAAEGEIAAAVRETIHMLRTSGWLTPEASR